MIALLLTLPNEKRQPNLLFAATRLLFGTPSGWCQFRRVLRENEDAIRAIMLKRSTQTNEPARCATLLPVLARLPQPLALIEVGASAGLCLMADRYGYDYGRGLMRPSVDQLDPPLFVHGECDNAGPDSVDTSGSRRDHSAKYGCLSARPRVRCLCPPGKTQHLLPKSVFDRPGSDRWNCIDHFS
jgi:hypothetical protein